MKTGRVKTMARACAECGHVGYAHGDSKEKAPGMGDPCRAVPNAIESVDGACPCPGWSPDRSHPVDAGDAHASRDDRVWALEKALDVLGKLDEGPVLSEVLAYAEYIRTGERP